MTTRGADGLSDKKRRAVEALKRRAGLAPGSDAPIPRRASAEPAPLSFAQQRLWVLDQIEPGIPLYNIQKGIRLRGELDEAALALTFGEIARRHEALRTTFSDESGVPVQIVHPPRPVELDVLDLRHLPAAEREQVAGRTAVSEARFAFDLRRGPLFRLRLVRLAADDHAVLLTLHHTISDGWSMRVLMEEVAALYAAYVQGRPSPLPEPTLQYSDYARWQQETLAGERLTAQVEYWRRQLAGAPPSLELPVDRPRPAVQTYRGGHVGFVLAPELAEALRRIGQAEHATVFMTLLAAFQVFLHRHSGQPDVSVGTPFAGRGRRELEPLIGMFVNTVVLRAVIDPAESFRAWLGRVRETVLAAQANQDVPFEQVVEALGVERRLSHTPLFQVMFALQAAPRDAAPAGPLRFEPVAVENSMSKFELTLFVTDTGANLTGAFEYNADLFEASTVERMIARFQRLLESIAADADTPVARLALLPAAERDTVVRAWNDTAAPYPLDVCIQDLFLEQVRARPEAPAVVFGDEQLTYAGLALRAESVARSLRSVGTRPGDYVACLMPRSLATVPSLLGILHVEGAYVPLEATWPRLRMQAVLQALKVRVAVTQRELLPLWRELAASVPSLEAALCVDAEAAGGAVVERLSGEGALRPVPEGPRRLGADAVAYVIFTSGSTGTPKGVMVRHRPVINLIHWANARFRLGPADRVLFVTSLCFDLSVYDIFGVLAAGGVVDVVADDDLHDPDRLVSMLAGRGITFWDSAPAALQQLVPSLERLERRRERSLRLVFLSGDWIPLPLPGHVRRAFPQADVIALGGATEATVWSNFFPVPETLASHWVSIPYGRPMPNAGYYVLDPWLEPCPIGVPGDLHIGGECLAEGYAGDPGRTAERFIPDPFGRPGGRLYRTGDMARFFADGNIEFLGRRDQQIKVRGFRIELGEIEAVLREHGGVREAVVEAREDVPGEKRLVGYVVPREAGRGPSASELRAHVKERLPEYMVPSAWVELGELPRTAHGKLDRKALPVPATAGVERRGYEEPRTEVERTLCRIWEEVLRVPRVGVRDNFFELGGDSILSIQIVSRARAEGLQLVVKQLFQRQTVAELAEVAEPVGAAEGVEAGVVTGRVELTPIQRWFFEQEWAEPWHFNQSVLLESRESVSEAGLRAVVSELLKHHDALRMCYRRVDGEWEQEIVETAGEAVVVESVADSSELERRCAEWQTRFDLERGPLLRVVLFRMSGQRDRVLLVAHHLVVDGVSWRVLLEDVQSGYAQWGRGGAISFGAKTASFKRWSERLQEYAASEAVQAQWDYWERQCAHAEADDAVRDEAATGVGALSVTLGAEETRALLTEVPGAYGTRINDALLLALTEAAGSELEGGARRGLRVELEGHGREESVGLDVSRTVGWFTTQYPVWIEVESSHDVGARLKAVKERLRQVPDAGLGYGLLRYRGGDEPRRGRLRQRSRLSFNYLGQLDAAVPAGGLFEPARQNAGPARATSSRPDPQGKLMAAVLAGELRVSCSYSKAFHDDAQVRALLERFLDALRGIIAHCRSEEAGGYTPSDFPLADIDQATLDKLASTIEFS